jgi:hypothetical protein
MQGGVDVSVLERALEALIKDWERFFGGVRQVPPQIERARLERRLRHYDDDSLRGAARFRLQQLQHRFSTYAQMWDRMLREREEGRGRSAGMLRAAARAAAPGARTERAEEANAEPAPAVDSGGKDDLYERFVAAKRQIGQTVRVDADAFTSQIDAQRRQLEQKLGTEVRFDVVVDGDKVKLAARRTGGGKDRE